MNGPLTKAEQLKHQVLMARAAKVLALRSRGEKESTITPTARGAALPLSWAQLRLWFLDRMDPQASAAYHMPAGLRLRGRLDVAALHAALTRIVARHEVLRTRFVEQDGEPLQQIDAPAEFALAPRDLSGLARHEQASAVGRLSLDEASAPFDLARGPLIRGQLLRLGEEDHVLLLTQHHIVSDGWSIGLLIEEVTTLYTAFSQGLPDPLPPLAVQYADYAQWQRRWLQGDILERQLAFWRGHLGGAPALLELPLDRPRPVRQSYAGAEVPVRLPAALADGLRQLAREQGATLFMTLLAGWSILLARLSGQDEVVTGTPVANRQRGEVAGLIGFFVNTLALRVSVEDDPTVAQLLAQVKAGTLDAYSHQDLPFERVVEALKPPRSTSHSPLFQVMINLDNTPAGSPSLPGLALEGLPQERVTAQFELSLALQENAGGLHGAITYASALFDAATVERFVRYFHTILAGMVADAQQPVSRLRLLDDAGLAQLADFNATAHPYPSHLVHGLFEEQVARDALAPALIVEGRSMGYGELNRRANRLAHRLRALGIGPDERVGICIERSAEMVVGLLAILKAGGAYVPLEPDYPAERLAYMLADSAPRVLLTHSALRQRLGETAVPVLELDRLEGKLAGLPESNPEVDGLRPQHLAYVIYTSGSTGQPKGVMNQHDGVVNRLLWAQDAYRLTASDRVLQKTPMAFDVSVWEFFLPLLSGAQLVMARPQGHQDPHYLAETIETQGITMLHFVPSMLQLFMPLADAGRCASLRRVLCSGEALPVALQQQFHRCLPQVELHNLYGPTEAAVDVTAWHCMPQQGGTSVPIGRPIANTTMYVLDRHGQMVPPGVAGELYIGGVQVARGYLNRPQLTAERFVADPFSGVPQARMYKTGDVGRWLDDGALEYLGRNDFQVKLRGQRIELGEIEARLATCAGVREAVVVARGAGTDMRLVAYLVPQAGAQLEAGILRAALARQVAEYMIPGAFVMLDAFPLTPNGKLDRKALPAPDATALVVREYAPPQGAAEEAVAAIWQELLGLEQVGRDDHFFELGGHSLMVMGMLERLRQRGWHGDVRGVFGAPTVQALGRTLSRQARAGREVPPNGIVPGATAITPEMLPLVALTQAQVDAIVASVPGGAANVQDIYPLAPLQAGILFHHMLGGEGDTYLMRSVLKFDTAARMAAFLAALQQVIDRHDILRSAVQWQGLPQPVQVVYRTAPLSVTALAGDAGTPVRDALVAGTDPRRMRLDLQRAPLLSAWTAREPDSEVCHLALLTHHMVCDHVTLELVIGEIGMLLGGQGAALAPALPYRNFVADTLTVDPSVHEAYFRAQLGDVDEPTAPFGLFDVHGDGQLVEEVQVGLDDSLASLIRNLARRHGVSPAVLFHVAWAMVVAHCSDRREAVFGTVLSGRLQGSSGADRVLGMFINTLPMRIKLDGVTVGEAVATVYGQLSELLEHEQAPLSMAQRCSGVAAPLPLLTSLLNYRHSRGNAQDPQSVLAWEGIEAAPGEERSSYPLAVAVNDLGQGFSITAQCVGVSAARVAALLASAVEQFAHALRDDSTVALGSLAILPQAQRQQLLAFQGEARDYPSCLVHELFEEQAARDPLATALIFDGRRMGYGELNRRANQLAHRLHGMGIGAGSRVAICSGRNMERIVAILGVLKAGAAFVPIDAASPNERIAYMLADCAPALIVTEGSRHAACAQAGVALLTLESLEAELAGEAGHDLALPGHDDASELPAYVMYTSGSTGEPKGAVIEHGNILNLLVNNTYCDIHEDDCVAHVANAAFDTCTWEIWGPLLHGARVLIVPPAVMLEPQALLALLLAEEVSHLALPTGLFTEFVDALKPAYARMRYVLVGGDKLDPNVAARLLGSGQAPQHLLNVYGPTEATFVVLTHELSLGADPGRSVPLGRPLANTQIHILDCFGQMVPVGARGEIYIGGKSVGSGYWNRPELTARRYLPDRFSDAPGAQLYRTGDLGRWLEDGTVEFLGRNDFQVKLRGFRIELGEIEARLSAYPGVREAVVMMRDDGGVRRLVAYLMVEPGAQPAPDAVRGALAQQLAEYMIPSAFVAMASFPLTPNGKVDRKALPAPDLASMLTRAYAPPQGREEEAIAALWRQLLAVERVGRDDSFFELGGHSLLAVQFVARMHTDFNARLSLSDILAAPTPAGIAALLKTDREQAAPNLECMREQGEQAALFFIHDGTGELTYARRLLPWLPEGIPVYGINAGLAHGNVGTPGSIQELASSYVRQMRSVQPHGPYRLAGYSAGGTIAYEMAQQLVGVDERIDLLVMLDSLAGYGNLSNYTAPPTAPGQDLAALDVVELIAAQDDLPSAVLLQLREMAAGDNLDQVLAYCKTHGLLPQFLEGALLRNFLAFSRRLTQALRSYVTPPLSLPLHLVAARGKGDDHIVRGWTALAGRRLQVWPVEGDHLSMMVHPQVDQVGRILGRLLSEASAQAVAQPELAYSPCITIQTGRSGRKPVFCVPGAGAAVTAFSPMAQVLRDVSVYGFQPRGYCGTMTPHADVPSAARAYIAAMRKVDAAGPYRLVGHSFGGWVAFEMAAQLRAMGAEVELLLLLDSQAPHSAHRPPKRTARIEMLMKLVSLFELSLASGNMGIVAADFEERDAQAQVALLLERLVVHRLMPPRTSPGTLNAILHVFSANLNCHYEPGAPYPGTVHLASVCDSDDPESVAEDAAAIEGWRAQAGVLRHYAGGGNHNTLLTSPHIDAVLAWVEALRS